MIKTEIQYQCHDLKWRIKKCNQLAGWHLEVLNAGTKRENVKEFPAHFICKTSTLQCTMQFSIIAPNVMQIIFWQGNFELQTGFTALVSWQETVKTLEANSDSRRGWKIIHTLVQCSATVFFGYIARGCNVWRAVRRNPKVQSPFPFRTMKRYKLVRDIWMFCELFDKVVWGFLYILKVELHILLDGFYLQNLFILIFCQNWPPFSFR